jgi:Peptidase family M28
MPNHGWKQLLAGAAALRAPGKYPIEAYSEFMPPPRLGVKAYSGVDSLNCEEADPWGWHVTEYEEAFELQPGLELLAHELLHVMHHLGRREPAHGIAQGKLAGNPYWPKELHDGGAPEHERYVLLAPLALSRTQDDKGRVRWTLFGASEQGPGRAFWRSFFRSPSEELPNHWGPDFIRRLLGAVYNEPADKLADLHRLGFRIMPTEPSEPFAYWRDDPLPSWAKHFLWKQGDSLRGVKYLLTFNPFAQLPAPVRKAYRSGALHLLPFPGSLVFWGAAPYVKLSKELPLAMQIPLLHSLERHEAPRGIRVPQSGWMHEPRAGELEFTGPHGPLRNTFHRTHRWARIHRHEDELSAVQVGDKVDKVAHVLFSAAADDIGLYGKPMARNAEVWTADVELLLNGPLTGRRELVAAAKRVCGGGKFGYRFVYPAMRVGLREVYWHRPLVAWLSEDGQQCNLLPDAPLGYLTAYRADHPQPAKAIELWPRLLRRGPHEAAVSACDPEHDQHYRRTTVNIHKLLDAWQLLGRQPLERSFARQLLTLPRHESLDAWLAALPQRTNHAVSGRQLVDQLELRLAAPARPNDGNERAAPRKSESLTYAKTAKRSFEVAYWRLIAELATGQYVNKDNADCVLDPLTLEHLKHEHRDLEALGDYILKYYDRVITEQKMSGQALAGEFPFTWRTDFDYDWMGGWKRNQAGETRERDLVCVIPGRDRRHAVIMGDHYDTAYMEDRYGYMHGGKGPRLAAAGADDNHSATATLMLAAPILMELSRQGKLACDIWLVHLTGEEFPADCLGARHLTERLVEENLRLRLTNGRERDLSKVAIRGLYVLDMVAHNNDRDPDVFQMCPGTNRESMWLAYQAHLANRAWNESAPLWNSRAARKNCRRGQRSADPAKIPAVALHPQLSGEVRPTIDPRSTLFNTDGQIFSDAGIPAVLFMENYDINRQGYHDSHDTMENIDLDYGSAVAAMAIESVARAATELPPWE